MSVFADRRQTSTITATSIEQSPKEVGSIMPTHICTYPENLVQIGPAHSDNQGTVKKKKSNIGTSYISLPHGKAGWAGCIICDKFTPNSTRQLMRPSQRTPMYRFCCLLAHLRC